MYFSLYWIPKRAPSSTLVCIFSSILRDLPRHISKCQGPNFCSRRASKSSKSSGTEAFGSCKRSHQAANSWHLKIKALAVSQLWMQGGFSNLLNTSQHLGMTSFAQSGFLFEKTHQPWKSPNTLLPEGWLRSRVAWCQSPTRLNVDHYNLAKISLSVQQLCDTQHWGEKNTGAIDLFARACTWTSWT